MQKRKFDELISHFNRKVSDMSIDQKYKMELLGMISAIGFAHEKELGTNLAEVGTDCISRQAAIDFIDAGHLVNPNEPRWSDNEVVNFLKSRPSAQPEINCSEFPNNSDTISRQDAVSRRRLLSDLKELITAWEKYPVMAEQIKGVEVAIGYVELIPSAQPEPDQNGDLWITVSDIDKVTCIYVQESKSKFCRIFYEEQPERIKGHWIEHDDGLTACECSVCHEKYALYEEDVFGRNFCPNCGADMREVSRND